MAHYMIQKIWGSLCLRALLLTFATGSSIFAQKSLTVDECQQKARENYPLIHQYGLLDISEQYTVSNIGKAWLPQVALNAQATYQSDVVHFPISFPGLNIPTIDKDQYKATVDVSQTIWDGGMTRSQKEIVKANNEVDRQNVEVNLYTLRNRINQLFFGILTIDEQLKQLDILEKDLQTSHTMVNAWLQNGVSTQSDVDMVQVEILNTAQKRIELISWRKAYVEMLSVMISDSIDTETQLIKPSEQIIDRSTIIHRPEMMLFEKQNELFDAQTSSITARNMPRLSLFVQGGYGKPGLNMLSNDFEFFYIGGIRLNWNFGNLYSSKNERNILTNNKSMVGVQQETFVFNTNLQLTQAYHEIEKARELMQRDDEIITLRHRVKVAAESKYENGVYTVNDLIKDINAENQSRQAKILHEVQYLMSIYQYQVIAGE